MIGSTRAVRVFARSVPTDLRKGFDGLYGLVREELGQDPRADDLFLFVHRRRTSAKVLHWDGTGLCIYDKRLCKGRFARLWTDRPSQSVRLTRSDLALSLEGATLSDRLPLSPPEISI